jgi:TonB-linked SusC/RagA family outer membrane protein
MKQIIVCGVLLLIGNVVLAQRTISGVVSDSQGVPLPGVTVAVQNTNRGAVTDFDGFYEVSANPENILIFSYVGFEPQQIPVGDQNEINVTLIAGEALDEVVVVGYGTQKKSDVTGAVASVDAERLEEMPYVNLVQALQGTMPGVNISVNTNTASGASTSINIRGRRSITGGSDPLIVLDGVIFAGSLTEINMNDIQSIEVLKDASSAAIYGSRGANGVILLTTKKGSFGKPRLSVNTYYGVDRPYELPAMMDAETFYARKVIRFGEEHLTDTERQVFESGEAVDWVDLVLRDGSRTEHNISISGGSESMKYFVSGNYQDVKGVAVNDNFSKVNLRTNVEADLTDWLKIGTNTLFSMADRSGIAGDFGEAFFMNPLTIAYNEDGSLTKFPWPDDTGFSNPLENTLYDNQDKTNSLITNNYLLLEFPGIEGLSYKLNTGYTLRGTKAQTYRGRDTRRGDEVGGYASQFGTDVKSWLVENILNYNRDFGNHSLFITALYSAQERTAESLGLTGTGFPNDVRSFYQFGDAEFLESSVGYTKANNLSQMLRINYNYKSKYLLTLTGRRDGYSAFGDDKKYGLFPSVAIGWNLAREPFLENSEKINNLKLRASYGVNGNEAISPYVTLANLAQTNYIDASGNNLIGYRSNRLANPNLGWESTTSLNLGLDFGLFKSRINGSLDVFASTTEDLLLSKSIPAVNAVTSITQNIGKTKGKGVELAMETFNISTPNFQWKTQFSFTKNVNEIVHVGLTDEQGNYIDDVGSGWFIGQPIDVNFGYVIEGVWQLDEVDNVNLADYAVNQAGDVKYADINGDGKITPDDRRIIGSLVPDFTLGLTNYLTYKNFSLSVFLYWEEGVTKRNALITTNDFLLRRRVYNNNYWSPTNPTNDFPENADRTTNPLAAAWYEDASFLRIRDITLSYRFPQPFLDKLDINNMELFVNGKNLVTLTNWRGTDPEISNQLNRPFSRTFILGARFGF